MLTRPFGSTGLSVPVLGYGAMQLGNPALDEAHTARMLNHVLDQGLTLIDAARSYGLAEQRIGRHLAARRDEYVLSTKVGYGIDGVADWTYECVIAGVDAARDRLRADVIDIVHLHSCPRETLARGDVVRALARCRERGKLRVAAYAGDAAPLRRALDQDAFDRPGGVFQSVQVSVNLCDQEALPLLADARSRGFGTLAKRSLAGRPWTACEGTDTPHAEYRRRYQRLRGTWTLPVPDWDDFALRFAAYAPGVDCVIVGGVDPANVDRNLAAVNRGALMMEEQAAVATAFEAHGSAWQGLV